MKPLKTKTLFVTLPVENEDISQNNYTVIDPNTCIPVDTKNHMYLDDNGNTVTGHWVIFPGKKTYRSKVTKQLALTDSTTMHQIVVHLHPFAEELTLKDITKDSILFTSKAINYKDKIGLIKADSFTSTEGVMLYPNHEYEMILKVNNTSEYNQDMMASMFLFLYDKEMDVQIQKFNQNL